MDSVLFSLEKNVAVITLNRPAKLNAFNRAMALQLLQILNDCSSNPEVKCLYVTGAGKAFSAGQDLEEVLDPEGPGIHTILSEHYNPLILAIRNLQKPVVAGVNGVAAGAGANIALCCDIVIASSAASFIQAFSKIGLIPDSGGTFFLPRLIGFQKAAALMMLGDKIVAEEAEKLGMIYKVFADESFEAEAKNLAQKVAALPPKALWLTKKALNESINNNLSEQLLLEDTLQSEAAATEDFDEGVAAFLEKRKPIFKGR